MLRLYDIPYQDTTSVTFTTEELGSANFVPYVVYDTSTGYSGLEDYYTWRAQTFTSTGMVGTSFVISNSNLYPKFSPAVTLYTSLQKKLFYIMSQREQQILITLIDRLDLVRRRLPNPGAVIEDVDGMGNRGVVALSGGYDKKFAISELMRFIEGSLIEINIHPPATNAYWLFTSVDQEKITNPYNLDAASGVPYKLVDLIIQGAVIRALVAWGVLEIDLNFSTSDSGLQITYDKVAYLSGWMDRLLQEFQKQKDFIKWDFVNSYGVGVGSLPYAATGIWGTAMNMIQHSDIIPLTSMLGFNIRSNVPL